MMLLFIILPFEFLLLKEMLTQPNTRKVYVRKVRAGVARSERDVLAVEEPLELRLMHRGVTHRVAVTMRTPGEDFEMVAGFLFCEGIIQKHGDVREIRYCIDSPQQLYNIVTVELRDEIDFDPTRLQRNFFTTSACGICGKVSLESLEMQGCVPLPLTQPVVPISLITGLDAELRRAQQVFSKTGGLHAAALFDLDGQLQGLHEDVGRHNALDKLIGSRFMAGQLPVSQQVLILSGRTSFELMQKSLMAQIPIIVSVGAPSSLAVELAQNFNITLIGFLRGDSFNIYAGPERVK